MNVGCLQEKPLAVNGCQLLQPQALQVEQAMLTVTSTGKDSALIPAKRAAPRLPLTPPGHSPAEVSPLFIPAQFCCHSKYQELATDELCAAYEENTR